VTLSHVKRDSYHHGDLANALTGAAIDLARVGGPEAVVLREAARKVGVSPTAAYRHFSGHGDLIHAVKEAAQADLAASMQAELATREPLPDPAADAVRRLRALGRGYVRFALSEPGLFRTAFCRADKGHEEVTSAMLEAPAFQMLTATLDDLVEAGLLPPARRPFGETAAWAIAHGLAMLLLDGPLATVPEPERESLIEGALDTIITGLCGPAAV
jgi:AcrR family transcriptional regulator